MGFRTLIIIPIYNQETFIENSIKPLIMIDYDILIIDDGSTDNTYDIVREYSWIKYIKNEKNIGSGASFITGCKFAIDFGYDVIITLDSNCSALIEEIQQLVETINYGYDIVTSSRILENYDYQQIPGEYIEITTSISESIKEITKFDITDPLSGIKSIRIESIKNMELTDFSHGLFLQLWIQSFYFGLNVIEIPAKSGNSFGEELKLYDDPLSLFLSIIETEKYLYKKGKIN